MMPRKNPRSQEVSPPRTQDLLKSFAAIIAKGAIRAALNPEIKAGFEPEINQEHVVNESSDCNTNTEIYLKNKLADLIRQPSLFE
jgi:hypothetical protein